MDQAEHPASQTGRRVVAVLPDLLGPRVGRGLFPKRNQLAVTIWKTGVHSVEREKKQ